MLETAAAIKSALTDTRHTFGNRHACESGAIEKGVHADALNTVTYRQACESRAHAKGRAADGLHAVRNRHACETAAAVKRHSADTCHAGADFHGFYAGSPRDPLSFISRDIDNIIIHCAGAADGEVSGSVKRPCEVIAAAAGFAFRQ